MKNYFLFLIPILALALSAEAQQGVGIGTTMPNGSSILDLTSTTKGFLIPRMTGAQRGMIGSPVAGLQVYQTNTELIPFSSPDCMSIMVHPGNGWRAPKN